MLLRSTHFVVSVAMTFVVCAATSRAQTTTDVRLSGEPTSYALPDDARIQAAASIGNRTLVVWGNSEATGDGSIRTVLDDRILANGIDDGWRPVMHDREARPFGFVAVVPDGDLFLVIWNDRRADAPGVYLQRVDLGGGRLNASVLLSRSFIDDSVLFVAGASPAGLLIAWNTRDGESVRTVGARVRNGSQWITDAVLVDSARTTEVVPLPAFPGDALLRHPDGRVTYVHADGSIELREIPRSRFDGPFDLAADTSLALVSGTSLLLYSNPFDSRPDQATSIPQIASMLSGSITVARIDSAHYAVHGIAASQSVDPPALDLVVRSILVDTSGSVRSIASIDSLHHALNEPNGCHYAPAFHGCSQRATCHGMRRVEGWFSEVGDAFCGTRSYTFGYVALPDGSALRSDDTAGICPDGTSVRRLRSDTVSSVEVTGAWGTSEVDTMTASRRVDAAQMRPVLMLDGDTVRLVYQESFEGGEFLLGRWMSDNRPVDVDSVLRVPALDAPAPNDSTSAVTLRSYERHEALVGSGNSVVVGSVHQRTDDVTVASHPPHTETWMTAKLRVFVPVRGSWRKVDEYSASGPGGNWRYGVESVGDEPTPGGTIASVDIGNEDQPLRNVIGIGENGDVVFRNEDVLSTQTGLSLVPTGGRRYLACGATRCWMLDDGAITDSIEFSVPAADVAYFGVGVDRFLRVTTPVSAPNQRLLALYGSDGALIARTLLTFGETPRDLCVAVRSTDSTIVLLWASRRGTRATSLDAALRVMAEDVSIGTYRDSTAQPTGVFRGDTLFVAWSDARDGEPDIYGATYLPPMATVDVDDATAAAVMEHPMRLSVRVNPFGTAAIISYALPAAGSPVLELVSMRGAVVCRRQLGPRVPGRYTMVLETGVIQPGPYFLAIRTSTDATSAPIVIAR